MRNNEELPQIVINFQKMNHPTYRVVMNYLRSLKPEISWERNVEITHVGPNPSYERIHIIINCPVSKTRAISKSIEKLFESLSKQN